MTSRLPRVLSLLAVVCLLLMVGAKAWQVVEENNPTSRTVRFTATLSAISKDLGTSASATQVSYSYKSGEPLKDVVDHISVQSGVPMTYTGHSDTRVGLGYSGNLDGALTNLCMNERLRLVKSSAGTFQIVSK